MCASVMSAWAAILMKALSALLAVWACASSGSATTRTQPRLGRICFNVMDPPSYRLFLGCGAGGYPVGTVDFTICVFPITWLMFFPRGQNYLPLPVDAVNV